MAEHGCENDLDQESIDLECETFEHNFRNMINWQQEKWDNNELEKENYYNVINSLRYWARKLKPAVSDKRLMLAVFKDGALKLVPDRTWTKMLKELGVWKEFKGFFFVRNPRVTGFQVSSEEVKTKILDNVKMVEGGRVIPLEWFYSDQKVILRVHWLPEEFFEEELKEVIQEFVEIEEFSRETRIDEDGDEYGANVINASGIQRKGANVDVIPHLINFKGLEALIVVKGRQPLCLNCEVIGHKAYECKVKHCKKCRQMMPKIHECLLDPNKTVTYATKVKNKLDLGVTDSFWPDLKLTSVRSAVDQGGGGEKPTSSTLPEKPKSNFSKSTVTYLEPSVHPEVKPNHLVRPLSQFSDNTEMIHSWGNQPVDESEVPGGLADKDREGEVTDDSEKGDEAVDDSSSMNVEWTSVKKRKQSDPIVDDPSKKIIITPKNKSMVTYSSRTNLVVDNPFDALEGAHGGIFDN